MESNAGPGRSRPADPKTAGAETPAPARVKVSSVRLSAYFSLLLGFALARGLEVFLGGSMW